MEKFEELKKINNRDDMYVFLSNYYPDGNMAELGVAGGINLKGIWDIAKPKVLIGVDIFKDDGIIEHTDTMDNENYYNLFLSNVEAWAANENRGHPDRKVFLIKELTSVACKVFGDGWFDFVYIDADHSYNGCKEDLENWWRTVKGGGVIGGHDYFDHDAGNYKFGVVEAVNEFRAKNNIRYFHHTPEVYGPSWFIIKE